MVFKTLNFEFIPTSKGKTFTFFNEIWKKDGGFLQNNLTMV